MHARHISGALLLLVVLFAGQTDANAASPMLNQRAFSARYTCAIWSISFAPPPGWTSRNVSHCARAGRDSSGIFTSPTYASADLGAALAALVVPVHWSSRIFYPQAWTASQLRKLARGTLAGYGAKFTIRAGNTTFSAVTFTDAFDPNDPSNVNQEDQGSRETYTLAAATHGANVYGVTAHVYVDAADRAGLQAAIIRAIAGMTVLPARGAASTQ